jgi:tripartite-type tricarboxylate transporter receptor subunit TctC
MKRVPLRNFLFVVMGVVGIIAILHSAAFAQAKFPTRPVTLWVGLPPGGSADVLARALAAKRSSLSASPEGAAPSRPPY